VRGGAGVACRKVEQGRGDAEGRLWQPTAALLFLLPDIPAIIRSIVQKPEITCFTHMCLYLQIAFRDLFSIIGKSSRCPLID
jgi:hypothetical protein